MSNSLKLGTALAAILLIGAAARPPKEAQRPKIFRIERVEIPRVELMEFAPTEKPCCSDYTGKHPGP